MFEDWNLEGMQRGWESEIGGSRPGTEMVGGDFLSRPRPYMGFRAWVDGSLGKNSLIYEKIMSPV